MVKLFVMDVDGTLTDGKIYIGNSGEEMKAFNAKDGYAIHNLLKENSIKTAIITGRKSDVVEIRAKELDVDFCIQGVTNKFDELNRLIDMLEISKEKLRL